ncbi:MAG: hypothetical protein RB296_10250 [Acidobacteriota bacterium]|jgi:hypothetical protein|nr:hypothetical protein [Acidobacteriota bacterium]
MVNRIVNVILVTALCLSTVHAGQTKKIIIGDFEAFQSGTLNGTAVDSRGWLFIGPRIQRLDGPDQEYYLSVTRAANGDILLGTGHGARVFRLPAAGGKAEEIFQSEHLDVYGLVSVGNEIYVGTAPNGAVYRLAGKEKAQKLFTPRERFIWGMAADEQGRVYCAVGNPGAVYRLSAKEEPVKLFDADDTHVTSLYAARDGAVYAGSAERGLLFRVADRKARVMFDSPFEEVRGICEDNSGNLFFAATRNLRPKIALKNGNAESAEAAAVKKEHDAQPEEKSALYRMKADGGVEKIWESRDETIYDLFFDRKASVLYVATGDEGRLYRVSPDGGYALVMEAPSAQLYALAESGAGLLAITNNTAGIWRVENATAGKGEYLSRVFDLGVPSRFGRLSWRLEREDQSGVAAVFARMGNSMLPDGTWTPWTPPFADPANARLEAAGYRHIQFKISLNSANLARSPRLSSLTAYYLQNNLKPRIHRISINREQKEKAKDKPEADGDTGKLLVRWQADDPNADPLQATLELRRLGASEWILLREHVTEKEFRVDPRMVTDGDYQLRIKVDDALANPGDTAQAESRISEVFTIDSTAPALDSIQVENGVLTMQVRDETSPVAEIAYSLDGKLWLPLATDDGLNDSRVESCRLPLSRVRGKRMIYIRFRDEAGNFKIHQQPI